MSPYITIHLVYLCLFILIIGYRHFYITHDERKTFVVLALAWAISVFFGNYAFYKLGIMSFTPWLNNLHHTFVWIGLCLTSLYMLTKTRMSIWLTAFYFVAFSFIVKVVEKELFGIWEHNHFFWIFKGNWAYIIGWSLMDGLYPFITKFGLRLLSKIIPGLQL